MTWSKEVTLWCDHEDCSAWKRPGLSQVKETRKHLEERGWAVGPDGDYCPEHAAKKES